MEDQKSKITFYVTIMVAFTLCVVILAMVFALMTGLFNKEVDNVEIFKLIGPAFQTIVGGFIGLLAGVKLSSERKNTSEENVIAGLLSILKKE
jgi:hypothetical protein